MRRKIIYGVFCIIIVLSNMQVEGNPMSSFLNDFSHENPVLGFQLSLDNPKHLEISPFEKSMLTSLNRNFEESDVRSELEIHKKMKNVHYRKIAKLTLDNALGKKKIRGSVMPLDLDFNITKMIANNDAKSENDTEMQEDDNDALRLPSYVQEQEDNGTFLPGRLLSKITAMKSLKPQLDEKVQKREQTLPEHLKIRVKIGYDQSFHNLFTGYGYYPPYIIWYLSELLKQIFALPGLGTKIEIDASSGNFNLKHYILSYVIASEFIYSQCQLQ